MSWKEKVRGGFGEADVIFAGHPLDEDRAKKAIKAAKDAGASRDEFEKELVWHVYKNVQAADYLKEHLDKTVKKLHKLWR